MLSGSENPQYRKLLQAVSGIVFFGVPNLGMDIESLKAMAGDGPNRLLLETIGLNSDGLIEVEAKFKQIIKDRPQIKIVCFYETKESPTATKVGLHGRSS